MEGQSFISVQGAQSAVQRSVEGPAGQDAETCLCFSAHLHQEQSSPPECFQHLLTARGESTAGSSEAGHEGAGSPDTSPLRVCYRDTKTQEPSVALGDFVIPRMCIPMCKVEEVFGVCKHQTPPKTMLAISPINQEAVVGSACQHPLPGCEKNCSPRTPHLLSLRAPSVEAAWG